MLKRKPKVFILGASGFLGHTLAYRLRKDFFVSGAAFSHHIYIPDTEIFPIDMKKADILEAVIRVYQPDFVVNCLGMMNPKAIEAMPKMADSLNILMAVSTAALANRLHAQFVQISCASVYEGSSGDYSEEDNEFSLSDDFGKQKLAAESYIRTQTMESTTLRVGKVVGIGNPYRFNFFDRMRIALENEKDFEVSSKEIFSWISAENFYQGVKAVLLGEFSGKHRVFNLGGPKMSELAFCQDWAKLVNYRSSLIKANPNTEKRDISILSKGFETTYPNWKMETKEELYLNLLKNLSPGLNPKKWQKILQIP
jgi:dTDP-4-dehydrorhamnose reductase